MDLVGQQIGAEFRYMGHDSILGNGSFRGGISIYENIAKIAS